MVDSTMLSVASARVTFGPVAALDGVDVAVEKGHVLGVLGASGSGKSTLLRVIAGLQPLDSGDVSIDGVNQALVPVHRRGVGLMFQAPTLFPHKDVAANVAFGLRMQRQVRADVALRVDELLDLVGLAGYGPRAVNELSGGEAQRVALARALAPEPRLLLLDEPFASLDTGLRQRLVEDVSDLVRRLGLTVVAVTHSPDEALAFADSLTVLSRGRVVRCGEPTAVWADPRTREVASILGLPIVKGAAIGRDANETFAIRASAVVLDPAGPIEGVIERRTLTGDRVRLWVRVAEGSTDSLLPVDVPVGSVLTVGDRAHLRLLPGMALPLSPAVIDT
jgi:thiamine transport system ATP-binding protein